MDIEWEILSRVIKGKSSDLEDEKFIEWYSGKRKQKNFIKDVRSFYALSEDREYVSEEHINKEWKKFVRSVSPLHRICYCSIKVAASIIIVCCLTVSFWYINKKILSPEIVVETINSGEHKAMLILTDGSRYVLSSNKDKVIESNGLLIKNKNKSLTFESGVDVNNTDSVIYEQKYNTIRVPRFGEYNLTLSDGTKVWLNAMSSLSFPNVFKGDTREVKVEGEVYFDVKHNPDKPFIVLCNNIQVKVLGTEFNIRSYEKNKIATTLVNGKVEMNYLDKPGSTVILKPGEQGLAESEKPKIDISKVNVSSVTAWKSGEFLFENRRLEDIMKELSMWYDINVFYENLDIKNERFYAYINRSDDFKKVLKKFEVTEKINIRVKGKNVIISKK